MNVLATAVVALSPGQSGESDSYDTGGDEFITAEPEVRILCTSPTDNTWPFLFE